MLHSATVALPSNMARKAQGQRFESGRRLGFVRHGVVGLGPVEASESSDRALKVPRPSKVLWGVELSYLWKVLIVAIAHLLSREPRWFPAGWSRLRPTYPLRHFEAPGGSLATGNPVTRRTLAILRYSSTEHYAKV